MAFFLSQLLFRIVSAGARESVAEILLAASVSRFSSAAGSDCNAAVLR